MNKTIRNLIIFVLIVGAAYLAISYARRDKPVEVTLVVVDRGRVEETATNTRAGTIKACRRARLAPATGGQVARLTVTEGDRVKTGEILVELWNDDLAARVKLAESDAAAVKAAAAEACVLADVAQREANRLTKLRKKGVASEEQVDKADGTAKAQRASCRAARARVEVGQAQVDAARATLERTILKAPFDGIVAEVNGELGEFVTPSPTGVQTPPAVDLIDESCLFVSAPIDEVDAPAIRIDMPARISMDAFSDRHCKGKVTRIAPYVLEVEKQARTVAVEAEFESLDVCPGLLPGYSADLEVILKVREDVVRVATDAVQDDIRVLIYNRTDGLLEEREIETGIANWQWTEVISGLSPGEAVVTSVGREGVEAGVYGEPEEPLPDQTTAQ